MKIHSRGKYKDIIDLLIIEKDNGLFDALNKGIQKALGNYIFLMGSDDSLFDNHILEDVKILLLESNKKRYIEDEVKSFMESVESARSAIEELELNNT